MLLDSSSMTLNEVLSELMELAEDAGATVHCNSAGRRRRCLAKRMESGVWAEHINKRKERNHGSESCENSHFSA